MNLLELCIGIISIVDANPDPDPERNQINVDPPSEPIKFHTYMLETGVADPHSALI
jgi:hypothetical protein